MAILASSIFYILTGWTCAINLYKYFYKKKLKNFSQNNAESNESQINKMMLHYKKADKLGKIFLTLWCLSAALYFYSLNV